MSQDPPRTRSGNSPSEADYAARADDTVLAHEKLRDVTERVKIAWGQSNTGPEDARAKHKLKTQAREFTALALATLVDAMMHGDTTASRVAAADKLLDRGFGKPKESVEVADKGGDAAALVAKMRQLRAEPRTAAALLVLAEATADATTGQPGALNAVSSQSASENED